MNSICASIILFNPEIARLEENIKSIIEQVNFLILIDNNSENIRDITNLLKKFSIYNKIYLFCFDQNKGIACALNRACVEAHNRGYDWIVTLDQDSVCPSNLVEEYLKEVNNDDVGIICPQIVDRNVPEERNSSNKKEYIKECITSGSMLNLNCWNAVGGFDEYMFIDGVDFDLCRRIIQSEKKILRINCVILEHEIGHIEIKKFLFWHVLVKNHSSFRKYYIARNTIYFARKHRLSLVVAYVRLLKLLLVCFFYEKNKIEKCKSILRGAVVGFKCMIPGYK